MAPRSSAESFTAVRALGMVTSHHRLHLLKALPIDRQRRDSIPDAGESFRES